MTILKPAGPGGASALLDIQKRAFAALLEERYPAAPRWELGTILQEPSLCRFYESLGYHRMGTQSQIKPGMDIIGYEKIMASKIREDENHGSL